MTDKEIYKARQEGFERISQIVAEDSDEYFIDFMNSIHQITQNENEDIDLVRVSVMEKVEIRKKMIELFAK